MHQESPLRSDWPSFHICVSYSLRKQHKWSAGSSTPHHVCSLILERGANKCMLFIYLERILPHYVRKIFFGSFYPLIHLLWEDRYVPVLFLVLSVTLKVLWKVTQRCPHALTGHTHTLVRASSGAPRSRSSSTTWSWPLRAAQCSGVSPSLK